MDRWETLHKYRTHAARGEVPEILCPNDEAECIPVLDSDGEPALRCIECSTVFHLGLHVFDQMTKNLKELGI